MRIDQLTAANTISGTASARAGTHVVHRGDTMSAIAARAGIPLPDLIAANPQIGNPSLIFPGDRIALPPSSSTHVVQRGDTMSGIATRSGVSLTDLIAANPQVANPSLIFPGDRIVVPERGGSGGITLANDRGPATRSTPAPSAGASAIRPDASSVAAARDARDHVLPASSGYCYKYVKQALLRTGAVDHYLNGAAAKNAGPELERAGFVNVLGRPGSTIRSAYDAPEGAVLVYGAAPGATDRNAQYGHIEIRTRDGFASDYFSPRARTGGAENGLEGRGRVLIGVYIKPDPSAAAAPQRAAPVDGPARVEGQALRLSAQDVIDLKKTLQTEWVQSAGTDQAKGIVDTILNRRASGHWGTSVAAVVNARQQFSDINGPVAHRDGRNSVSDLPASSISSRVDQFVDRYLAELAGGAASSVGTHLNYANPNYSDARNLPWIMALDGPVFGTGQNIHRHGTTPDLQAHRPGAYHVVLP